jgi:hypothetical protein
MSTSYSTSRRPSVAALGAGLSEESRKAMNAAFESLSKWRNDIADVADRNSVLVFDRMATAAKAMGWPSDLVDMTRRQMQQTTKMQLQMMDQVMDMWEQQMKSPGSPVQMPKLGGLSGFPSAFAGMGGAQAFPSFPGFDLSTMPSNPIQFWMQAAEMWQKSWQQGLQAWMEMQRSALEQASRASRSGKF